MATTAFQIQNIELTVTRTGPVIFNKDSYKRATWPRCAEETAISVFCIYGRIYRITVAKNPYHGNTLSTKARKIFVEKYGVKEFRFNLKFSFFVSKKIVASQIKKRVEKRIAAKVSDDGFIFAASSIIKSAIIDELSAFGFVRHPFANRELYVDPYDPGTPMKWDQYEV